MDTTTTVSAPTPAIGTRRDYLFGIAAGAIIGLLLLPILKTAKPSLYESLRFVIVPIFLVLAPLGLVVASWISRKIALFWQLAKFVLIGGMNTLVDIGILALVSSLTFGGMFGSEVTWLTLFGFTLAYYSLYKGLSFIIANVNSFFWNKYWTFDASVEKKTSTEFIQFFVVSFIGFLINVTVASLAFSSFHTLTNLNTAQWGLIAAASGSIIGLAWNFVGYKFIVFKR